VEAARVRSDGEQHALARPRQPRKGVAPRRVGEQRAGERHLGRIRDHGEAPCVEPHRPRRVDATGRIGGGLRGKAPDEREARDEGEQGAEQRPR